MSAGRCGKLDLEPEWLKRGCVVAPGVDAQTQTHGKRLANAWQMLGKHMANAWQTHCKFKTNEKQNGDRMANV